MNSILVDTAVITTVVILFFWWIWNNENPKF